MSNFIILLLFIIKSVTSYNISWSKEFEYFSERSRYPYAIRIREQSSQALIICFEELNDDKYGGLCESAQLDVDNEEMTFGSKTFFEAENASVPHEIQIWAGGNEGWTPYFLLGYTNGPDRSEGPGKVTMGRYLDGGGIMYSSNRMTFNPYSNDQTHLIELQNNSYFVICASVGPRNQYDTACKLGRYSTNTMDISLGSKVFNISKGHTTKGMATARINTYTFLVCYAEFIGQQLGYCVVGTVRNNFQQGLETDIIFSNPIALDTNFGVDEIKIIHATQSILFICYQRYGEGTCRLGQVVSLGGNPETFSVVITSQEYPFQLNGIDSPSIFRVPPGAISATSPELLGVCYVDANNGVCKFGEFSSSPALNLTFDAEETRPFGDRGVGTINAMYLGQNGQDESKIVVCYIKFAGSTPLFNRGLCKYGTIEE